MACAAWQHQAITWTNADFSLVRSKIIYTVSARANIPYNAFEIIFLEPLPHFPGVNS